MNRSLADYEDTELYNYLDRLTEHRRAHGRGRTEDAAHARNYCKTMRAKVQAELSRRKLPGRRADDKRVYGSGQQNWQKGKP